MKHDTEPKIDWLHIIIVSVIALASVFIAWKLGAIK